MREPISNSKPSVRGSEALPRAQLFINDTPHYLDLLIGGAKQGPSIDVALDQCYNLDDPEFVLYYAYNTQATEAPFIVVFKHAGKFVILTCRDTVRQSTADGKLSFKAQLISKPGLKRARVPELYPEPESPPSFENRPRWQDRSKSSERSSEHHHNRASQNSYLRKGDNLRNS